MQCAWRKVPFFFRRRVPASVLRALNPNALRDGEELIGCHPGELFH